MIHFYPIFLALKYLKFHPRKFWVLTLCGTLTILLPLLTYSVFYKVDRILGERAKKYPVLIGAKGSALGLVFHSLFYSTEISEKTNYGVLNRIDKILEKNQLEGYSIPILTGYQAMGAKIVGVSADFYDFADLTFSQGSQPALLGDVVVGSQLAKKLNLKPGMRIHSDVQNLFNLASSFRSTLHVTGILDPMGGPEDHVFLCDIKTAWLLEGIYHGHGKKTPNNPKNAMVQQIGVVEFVEVTAENIETFHPHGDAKDFPVTAILFVPANEKSRVVIKGVLSLQKDLQAVFPHQVVAELMEVVFQIQKVLNFYFLLVICSTILLFLLILFLSLRLREKELNTIKRMGCSRGTIVLMVSAEYLCIFISSVLLSILCTLVSLKILDYFGYSYFL